MMALSPPPGEAAASLIPSSNENSGRGCIVWFTQASMMQSAELVRTNTINEAHRMGAAQIKTTYDARQVMKL